MSGNGRFRQAGIPSALADEIMEFYEEHPWLGYRSLSNFVTAGARQLLQDAREEVLRKRLLDHGGPDDHAAKDHALERPEIARKETRRGIAESRR